MNRLEARREATERRNQARSEVAVAVEWNSPSRIQLPPSIVPKASSTNEEQAQSRRLECRYASLPTHSIFHSLSPECESSAEDPEGIPDDRVADSDASPTSAEVCNLPYSIFALIAESCEQGIDLLGELPAEIRELPESVLIHLIENQSLLGSILRPDGSVDADALNRVKLELQGPGERTPFNFSTH